MKNDELTFIDFTPIDLWRLGTKSSSRLNKLRVPPRPKGSTIDIQTIIKNNVTWVLAGTGGISTFNGKNPRLCGLHWWRIPVNTRIPVGLIITKNHTDRITSLIHYRIEPSRNMTLSKFLFLLTAFSKKAEKAFTATKEYTGLK